MKFKKVFILMLFLLILVGCKKHEHNYTQKYNEREHYLECECGHKIEVGAHDYDWIVDLEPTESSTGLRHEECKLCGYKRNLDTVIYKINNSERKKYENEDMYYELEELLTSLDENKDKFENGKYLLSSLNYDIAMYYFANTTFNIAYDGIENGKYINPTIHLRIAIHFKTSPMVMYIDLYTYPVNNTELDLRYEIFNQDYPDKLRKYLLLIYNHDELVAKAYLDTYHIIDSWIFEYFNHTLYLYDIKDETRI